VICPDGGALWTFALAPVGSDTRATVEALAGKARCGQHALF
jgi:hypothetical protein